MNDLVPNLFRPRVGEPSRASIAVRAAIGWVFVTSGALKFLYENQGAARFAKIGLPAPEVLAPLVGTVEIVGGLLVLLGLFARPAALALCVDMVVAIATTKVPLLFGAGPEPVGAPPKTGFFAFAYQARLDLTMLCACAYVVVAGAGLLSLDARLSSRRWEGSLDAALRERG